MHSLGSTKLHTMGDDPTYNANVGRDMQLKGGGEGQLTVACFLYFMQFNVYTPTGCLHRKPNNTHIYKKFRRGDASVESFDTPPSQ